MITIQFLTNHSHTKANITKGQPRRRGWHDSNAELSIIFNV